MEDVQIFFRQKKESAPPLTRNPQSTKHRQGASLFERHHTMKTDSDHHSPTPSSALDRPLSSRRHGKSFAAAAIALVSLLSVLLPARSSADPNPPSSKTVRKSAYILSVDLKAHTITINPMQFLTGAAALKAYRRDNPGAASVPNDHYTVNTKKDRVVLPLAKDAVVKLVSVGGTDHTSPVAVGQKRLVGYQSLTTRPFWITIRHGTVIDVEEQFVP
jgi:hypothetical protein